MGRLGCLAAACVIAFSTPAAAKVKVQLHIMDPGAKLVLSSGVEVRYFTLEPYKKLLEMDNELWLARKKLETVGEIEANLRRIIDDKDKLLLSKQTECNVYRERSERLYKKWSDAETALSKERSKFSWSSFGIGLGVGSGITAIAVTAIIISVKVAK